MEWKKKKVEQERQKGKNKKIGQRRGKLTEERGEGRRQKEGRNREERKKIEVANGKVVDY